jgi:protein O-mannosyl-transferase
VLDDERRIVENTSIREAWPPWRAMQRTNRPLAMYTFAMNYALHGLKLGGYHAANLGIHLATALLLYGLVRQTLEREKVQGSRGLALAVAMLWSVHPLQTEAVTYVFQRMESLAGLAIVATLYGFARSHGSRHPAAWHAFSVAASAVGMGCKEVTAAAPLLVLWYDRAFVASSWKEIVVGRKLYYFCLASTWGVLVWAMTHWNGDYAALRDSVKGLSPWSYLVSQAGVLAHYLRLCFWPSGLCLDYRWPVAKGLSDLLPQAVLIVGLLGLTVWAVFRRPRWGFLGAWFFLILAPTSSIMPIADLAVEHRMYLPSAAVVAAAVFAVAGLASRCRIGNETDSRALHRTWDLPRTVLVGLTAAAAIALGTATYLRNEVYQSSLAIWCDVVNNAPDNVRARNNYGIYLTEAGRLPEAIEQFSLALKISPHSEMLRKNLESAREKLREEIARRQGVGNRDLLLRARESVGPSPRGIDPPECP